MVELTPIQRFLGLTVDPQSPLELLGLDAGQCDERRVREALERRLARVSAHPEGRGHEADEVRLALHAAAAQAMDPVVRRRLQNVAQRAPADAPSRNGGVADPAIAQFRASALPAILRAGGLTRESRRYIAALAHAHGLSVTDVHRALGAGWNPAPTPQRSAPARPSPKPRPLESPRREASPTLYSELATSMEREGSRVRRNATIAAGVAGGVIAALLVVGLAALALLDSGRARPLADENAEEKVASASAVEDAQGEETEEPNRASPEAEAEPTEPERRLAALDLDGPVDPLALREALELALAELPRAPTDAAWRFDRAVEQLSVSWTRVTAAERTALLERVVDFLYRAAPGGASGQRALEAVGAGAARLSALEAGGTMSEVGALSGVWSVGALVRLAREEALPARVLGEIESRLARALTSSRPGTDGTFAAGAFAALRSMGEKLSAQEVGGGDEAREAWGRWFEAIDALEEGDARERALLGVVERILLDGPSPATAPLPLSVVESALARVSWEGALGATAAQRALIAWFDDPRVATRDLAVITEWLMSSDAVDGVGIRLVLRRTASPTARADLRERYASLFGVGTRDQDLASSGWAKTAREMLREQPGDDIPSRYAQAAALSRLNEAAARRWRGELHGAGALLSKLREPIDAALQQGGEGGGRVAEAGGGRDGAWAVQFLGAGMAVERKLELLSELNRRGRRLGRIDAGAVAEAALFGGQESVRRAAQRAVRAHRDQAVIVNGLLDALPSAARTERNSSLIEGVTREALPPVKQAEWRLAARRALVERLLELLAGGSDLAPIDEIAQIIGDAYAERAGSIGISTATTAEAAKALWERWRAEAERYASTTDATAPVGELERRMAGRLRLARGPIQLFAAAQVSAAEMMALVVAAERPSQVEAVRDVLKRMGEARRAAGSIETQLIATERAMTELWLIRFGEAAFQGDGA